MAAAVVVVLVEVVETLKSVRICNFACAGVDFASNDRKYMLHAHWTLALALRSEDLANAVEQFGPSRFCTASNRCSFSSVDNRS